MHRLTIRERLHGLPPNSAALIKIWNSALVDTLLKLVWDAYDDLHEEVLSKLDWTEDFADLERSITQDFARLINRKKDGFLPVDVQHGSFEEESRSTIKANAQPRQNDIAFVLTADPRIMWPLEAKVLKTDKDTNENLRDYIDTLNSRLLTGVYAPFSTGAAMLGYLMSGDAETVISHIGVRLGSDMKAYQIFPNRCHKTSDHTRNIPAGKDYPISFCCHHLILPL